MHLIGSYSNPTRRALLIVCCFLGVLAAFTFDQRTAAKPDADLTLNAQTTGVTTRFTNLFSSPTIAIMPPLCSTTGLIISEFRLRGITGPNDEFIELYNNTDQPITVCSNDGSTGWALVTSDGVVRFVVPNGTLIPARGHYLAVSNGYSLTNYAAGDLTYALSIPDNVGIALFNTAYAPNFTTSNRLDAAGFTTDTNTLFREGAGFAPVGATNGDFSLVRRLNSTLPQDTANNAADFVLVATNAGTYGGVLWRCSALRVRRIFRARSNAMPSCRCLYLIQPWDLTALRIVLEKQAPLVRMLLWAH